jgi:hypothetical protein
MTDQATAIKQIRGAAKKREKADQAKREATEELRRLQGSSGGKAADHPDCF